MPKQPNQLTALEKLQQDGYEPDVESDDVTSPTITKLGNYVISLSQAALDAVPEFASLPVLLEQKHKFEVDAREGVLFADTYKASIPFQELFYELVNMSEFNVAGGTVFYYDPGSDSGKYITQTIIATTVKGARDDVDGAGLVIPGLNDWSDPMYDNWIWLYAYVERGAGLFENSGAAQLPPTYSLPPGVFPYYPPYNPPGQPGNNPPGPNFGTPPHPVPVGSKPDGGVNTGDILVILDACEQVWLTDFGETFFDASQVNGIRARIEQIAVNSLHYNPLTELLVSCMLEATGRSWKAGTTFKAPPFEGQLEAFEPNQAWMISSGIPRKLQAVPRKEFKLFGLDLGNNLGGISFVDFVYTDEAQMAVPLLPEGSPVNMYGKFYRMPLLPPPPLGEPLSAYADLKMCAFVKRLRTPQSFNEILLIGGHECQLLVHQTFWVGEYTNWDGPGAQIWDNSGIKDNVYAICIGYHAGYGYGADMYFEDGNPFRDANSDLLEPGGIFARTGPDYNTEKFIWLRAPHNNGAAMRITFNGVQAVRVAIVAVKYTDGITRKRQIGPNCVDFRPEITPPNCPL